MDFGNTALLVAAVYGIVELTKKMIPEKYVTPRTTVLIVVIASFLSVFIVGGTVWADQQVIGGQLLSDMEIWDKVIVSLFLAGATVFGNKFLESIRNIGANQPPKPGDAEWNAFVARGAPGWDEFVKQAEARPMGAAMKPTVVAPSQRLSSSTLPPEYPHG